MIRIVALSLMALLTLPAPAQAQDATADRVKQLEEENRTLQRELDAARARIRQLEGGGTSGGSPASTARTTNDPGPDPWGNPTAALRTLGSKVREDLLAKGQALPDAASGEKVVQSYRQRAAKWIESMAKFRQPVEWRVAVSEAIQTSTNPREFDVRMHVLNADGALVGPAFTVRVPATAAPDMSVKDAAGMWLLKADVVPGLRLISETTSTERTNPFGDTPLIAPQLQCRIEVAARSLARSSAAPTRAAGSN